MRAQRLHQVPDVGADAEIPHAAGVDDDVRAAFYARTVSQLPAVERERAVSAATFCRTAAIASPPIAMLRQHFGDQRATSRISGSRKPRVVTAGRAEADAARIQRRIRVERNRVLVDRDVGVVERLSPLPCRARPWRRRPPASGACRCRRRPRGSPRRSALCASACALATTCFW